MRDLFFVVLLTALLVSGAVAEELLVQADSLYELRNSNADLETLLADPADIDKALEAYQSAVDQLIGEAKEEALWKLLRCYYFKGKFTTDEKKQKKDIFSAGIEVGYQYHDEFLDYPGNTLYLGILWGVWAEVYGKLNAAKEGAAGKIRDLCETTIELDPEFYDAGGYRILGRLHFKSPKIPLLLNWPSKKKAVVYLEKAIDIAPWSLYTQLYLAEALHKRDQEERAVQMLKDLLAVEETVHGILEDATIKQDAAALLAKWERGEPDKEEE
ncbi:hypothetical protein KJ564_15215 [bacterium]|nr:hypothetical protein [bacterium]